MNLENHQEPWSRADLVAVKAERIDGRQQDGQIDQRHGGASEGGMCESVAGTSGEIPGRIRKDNVGAQASEEGRGGNGHGESRRGSYERRSLCNGGGAKEPCLVEVNREAKDR